MIFVLLRCGSSANLVLTSYKSGVGKKKHEDYLNPFTGNQSRHGRQVKEQSVTSDTLQKKTEPDSDYDLSHRNDGALS